MPAIPTFIVNLPEDTDRLADIRAQLNPAVFAPPVRAGFLGRTLADAVCLRMTRDPNSLNNKGALGVMMSHLLLWEQIAQQAAPFALVLEDDVRLHAPERLAGFAPPPGFDVIFCNDRAAANSRAPDLDAPLACVPAVSVLPAIDARRVAVGGDAYLLSPAGARHLLALFGRHGYFGHVDMRMMTYFCRQEELDALGEIGPVTAELRNTRRTLGPAPPLAGYALTAPLATHVGMTSRRRREDKLGLGIS
jgi:GR25 family glycosyltransferase involved in LPS biosynthesis